MSAAAVIAAACAHGVRLTCVESCTGGLLAAALTDIAGASAVFDQGLVTYSNDAKIRLVDVSRQTLDAHGAVSEPVAREMAQGGRRAAQADIALAITGIAGPGPSEHKPEGRVCFALATAQGTQSETREFGAIGRDKVRQASVDHALRMLAHAISHMG